MSQTKQVPLEARGVSLRQYAAVQAGLGEGLELDVVLAHERIDPTNWPEAEDAWSDLLLDDLEAEGPLQEMFDAHLAQAQDRYGRRVPPLDEELGAWLDFVRLWAEDAEPVALLARVGLRASDMVRLHRAWSQRLAAEPALARKAAEHLQREPGQLPTPRPELRVYEPLAPPAANKTPDADNNEEPALFADLASWLAEQPSDGDSAAPSPADTALASGAAPLTPTPDQKSAGVASAQPRARSEVPLPSPAAIAAVAPADASPEREIFPALTSSIGWSPAMPFAEGAPPPPAGATTIPSRRSELASTGKLDVAALRAAVTPFQTPPAAPTMQQPARETRSTVPGASTAPLTNMPSGPPAGQPAAPATPHLALNTTGAVDASALLAAALPFMKPVTGNAVSAPAASAQAATSGAPARATQSPVAAPPMTPGTSSFHQAIDALTLAQYASLCAELTVFPEASEQTFHRYGLAAKPRRIAVDLAWQERLKRNAAEQVEWQRLYQHYQAHFRSQGR